MNYLSGPNLLVLATRLSPAILIVMLRPVSGWLVVVAVLTGTGAFVVGMYAGMARQIYLANEYSDKPAVKMLRIRLERWARLSIGLWLAYGLTLITMLVV